jgi:hypothetical protein
MLRRLAVKTALAVLLAAAVLPTPAHAIDNEQKTVGGACGASASPAEPANEDAADWDTIMECSSGAWQRAAYFFGNSTDTCDASHAGLTRYSSGNLQYCNSTAWTTLSAVGTLPLSGLTGATATNTRDHANYAQTWTWNTLTTQTALSLTSSTMTTGTLLSLQNTKTAALASGTAGPVLSVINNVTGSSGSYGVAAGYFEVTTTSTNIGAALKAESYGNNSFEAVNHNGYNSIYAHEDEASNSGQVIYSSNGGSSNTGIAVQAHNASATGWSFYADGTSPNYFAGNVGIGTTSPLQPLHVASSSVPQLAVDNTASGQSSIMFRVNGNEYWDIGTDLNSNGTKNFFAYDKTANAARLYIDTSGNVGIGTTSPGNQLEVVNNQNATTSILISNTTDGALAQAHFALVSSSGAFDLGMIATASSLNGGTYGDAYIWNEANTNLIFGTNNTEQMRLTNGGYLGIGTVSPQAPLDVSSTTANILALSGSNGNATRSIVVDTSGTDVNTNIGGAINFIDDGAYGANITFSEHTGAAGTAQTERMRINTNGRVGIGTTSPANTLDVNGTIHVATLATASATTICRNANVLASCSSSIRYKEKVKPAPFGLQEVMAMRPVTFKWKDRDENDLGLIAEEMEKINPLFVTYERGQIEGVKYSQLTAVLVKAVQEQQAEMQELKADNDNLRGELDELRKDVAALNGRPAKN